MTLRSNDPPLPELWNFYQALLDHAIYQLILKISEGDTNFWFLTFLVIILRKIPDYGYFNRQFSAFLPIKIRGEAEEKYDMQA